MGANAKNRNGKLGILSPFGVSNPGAIKKKNIAIKLNGSIRIAKVKAKTLLV
jgi:hypothetical protein